MLISFNGFYDLDKINEWLGTEETPSVKEICLSYTDNGNGLSAESIVHQAAPYIFDFDFPIHDETHRLALEEKIIKRYYFRHICCPDEDEWKMRLDARLNEIMPYYNKIYESFDYLVDFMDDVDYTREVGEDTQKANSENTTSTQNTAANTDSVKTENSEANRSSTSSGSTQETGIGTESRDTTDSTTTNAVNQYSDTPQGSLTDVVEGNYLTNANVADGTESKTGNSETERQEARSGETESTESGQSSAKSDVIGSTESSTNTTGTFDVDGIESGSRNLNEKVKGKMHSGSKSAYVLEYRKALMNVDVEIIGRLADLFLNVY